MVHTPKFPPISITISPFSDTFWLNIEDKMKPLVKALIDKSYMPFSCCQGHSIFFPRYVHLAFGSEAERDNTMKLLKSFTWFIPGVVIEKIKMPHNTAVDKRGKLTRLEKATINKESVMSFNTVFHQNYDNYYCLNIIIFRRLRDYIMKLLFWDKVTNYLVKKIKSRDFPRRWEMDT